MVLLVLAAALLGMLLPVQAGVNAQLRNALGHPLIAAGASFLVGTLAILLATALARAPWPSLAAAERVPWWGWIGGLLGAVYIVGTIVLAPRLGAALLTAAIIAGQLGAALALDHFGLVGFARVPVTATRVLGAGLLLAGVLLIQRR